MNKFSKKLSNFYYSNPIQRNLVLILLTIFITTTIPSIIIINIINKKAALEDLKSYSINTLEATSTGISQMVSNAEKISTSILSNASVQNILSTPKELHLSSDISDLESNLYSISATSSYNLSTYIYDKEGNSFHIDSYRMKQLKSKDIRNYNFYDELISLDGKTKVLFTKDIYKLDVYNNSISIIRFAKNLNSLEVLGIIVVNIDMKDVVNSYKNYKQTSNSEVLIFNQNGSFLFDPIHPYDFDLLNLVSYSDIESNAIIKESNNEKHLITYTPIHNTGLSIISVTPLVHTPNHLVSEHNNLLILIILINIILMLIGIIVVSRSITLPIINLANHMDTISDGNFNKLPSKYYNKNEIGYLTSRFNMMIEEIHLLIEKEKRSQKLKRQTELNLLQAQLKPHFLYNALDTARCLSLTKKHDNVNILLRAIGSYYQNILSKGDNVITIADEINTIRQYEIIQKYRMDNHFFIQYHIEKEVRAFHILKFILQPLVENSFKHGINYCDSAIIEVSAHLLENTLILSVKDNGIGMSQKQIKNILNIPSKVTNTSFGLRATIERMQLFYGTNFNYDIVSKLNQGTTIIFKIDNIQDYKGKDWSN